MAKVWVNVEGAIYRDNRWLMIVRGRNEKHAPGTISMVGGSMETETDIKNALEKTLIREIHEEVGIEIEAKMYYVESNIFTSDTGEKTLNVVFLCKYKSGLANGLTDEVDHVYWLTTSEVLEHPQTPSWIRQSIMVADKMLHDL